MTESVKLVIVGSGGCGKTCLLHKYCYDTFPDDYIPTVFDNLNKETIVDKKSVFLGLWYVINILSFMNISLTFERRDSAGLEDYDRLRPLSYPETDVFIMAYSVFHPLSFREVATRFYPEIQEFSAGTPILLVGLKIDLRDNQHQRNIQPSVTFEEGKSLAKRLEYVHGFIECSSKLEGEKSLEKVFLLAVRCALEPKVSFLPGLEKKNLHIRKASNCSDSEESLERFSYVISLGDLEIPLQNKTLTLWKSLLFGVSELQLAVKRLSKYSLCVEPEQVFHILFLDDNRVNIDEKMDVKDYYLLMKEFRLYLQVKFVFRLLKRVCFCFDDYFEVFKDFALNYENEYVQSWFGSIHINYDGVIGSEPFSIQEDFHFDHTYSVYLLKRLEKETNHLTEEDIQKKYLQYERGTNEKKILFEHLKLLKEEDYNDMLDEHSDFSDVNSPIIDHFEDIPMRWMSKKEDGFHETEAMLYHMLYNPRYSSNKNLTLKSNDGKIEMKVNKEVMLLRSTFFFRMHRFGGKEFVDMEESREVMIEDLDAITLPIFVELMYFQGRPGLSYYKKLTKFFDGEKIKYEEEKKLRKIKSKEEKEKEEEEEEEGEITDYEGEIIKIVAVGDSGTGMNGLLFSFGNGSFPEDYFPSVFDNFDTTHILDGVRYNISLVSTSGSQNYDEIRQMSYEDVGVVLCCFSVDNISSLSNISSKWVPEIRTHCHSTKVPIILVGNKCDLSDHEFQHSQIDQAMNEGRCFDFVLCSAMTGHNVTKVFDTAIRSFLAFQTTKKEEDEHLDDDDDNRSDYTDCIEELGEDFVGDVKFPRIDLINFRSAMLRDWLRVFCVLEKYQELEILQKFSKSWIEVMLAEFPETDADVKQQILIPIILDVGYLFNQKVMEKLVEIMDDCGFGDLEMEAEMKKLVRQSKIIKENRDLKRASIDQKHKIQELRMYIKMKLGDEGLKDFEDYFTKEKSENKDI